MTEANHISSHSPVTDEVLFERWCEHRDMKARNLLVDRHLGLAHHIAQRYTDRGVDYDDLVQVAIVGLVKAVSRFDPDRGVKLATYAARTMEGEVKRHFRDKTWRVKAPRSVKSASVKVRRAIVALEQQRGRSPTVEELAAHMDESEDVVVQALLANSAYRPSPLDPPSADDEAPVDHDSSLADDERGFTETEASLDVEKLLETLPPREREIVRLRFVERLSQSEIGDRVGISQMHVSRLLRRSLREMREAATGADPEDSPGPATRLADRTNSFDHGTSWMVPPRPSSIGDTREALQTWLDDVELPTRHCENLLLVLSELLTNAVQQEPVADVRVDVAHDEDYTFLLQVSNARSGTGDTLPEPGSWQPADPLSPSGRGLMIVNALCDRVRWRQTDENTVVQARYPTAGAAPVS